MNVMWKIKQGIKFWFKKSTNRAIYGL